MKTTKVRTLKHKPLIGILTNLLIVETGVFSGMERIYVNRDYVTSVLRAGGIPVLLPIIPDSEAMRQQIETVDAILISGGQDVHPHHYNEEPSHLLETVCAERDDYEIAVIKHAFQLQMPLFGVCRGMQLINVVFNGSLYQDISNDFQGASLQHNHSSKKCDPHPVNIVQNSWLFQVFEKETIIANSFHHQAIKDLAPGFLVNAWSKDGIIEGIENIDGSFVAGVQWHPEMLTENHPDMHKLFCAFVSEARKNLRIPSCKAL
ncbi:MAG: gamma-glutamyl-gamma-aminobutyrate hydrolase family protein [Parachlamydiaceae bacterium]|nr:gamma-glutamyl-gamma-aminobutyrate hydrolase family protein [Parachlamydiaceae bacterium]